MPCPRFCWNDRSILCLTGSQIWRCRQFIAFFFAKMEARQNRINEIKDAIGYGDNGAIPFLPQISGASWEEKGPRKYPILKDNLNFIINLKLYFVGCSNNPKWYCTISECCSNSTVQLLRTNHLVVEFVRFDVIPNGTVPYRIVTPIYVSNVVWYHLGWLASLCSFVSKMVPHHLG